MKFSRHAYQTEDDYWRVRNFLREVFMLNNRLEHSWHVARLDHWRWHFIATCHETPPVEQVTVGWETEDGQIAAVLHPIMHDEIRIHIQPNFRSPELEDEILAYAEPRYSDLTGDGQRIFYLPVFWDDTLRQEVLKKRGYSQRIDRWEHHYWCDLDKILPETPVLPGYEIRSMGGLDEHPARSWASWRTFHAGEPDSAYDPDPSWFLNLQSAPLYRRDLDIVAVIPSGEMAAFCTISYDDVTHSAVVVLAGTTAEHCRRGLGRALMIEGMLRLKDLGCTRMFASAEETPEDALYRSLMPHKKVTHKWIKLW